jgi:hypothetical protein
MFGEDEIIISKTDLQGRITYANSVFLGSPAMRRKTFSASRTI